MKIKDCIIRAIKLLGLARLIENDNIDEQNEEIKAFFDISKTIIEEVVSDYYPLKRSQSTNADKNGIILFKNLSYQPINFYSLTKNNISYPFFIKYDSLETSITGECKVEYSYMPKISTISDDIPLPERIGERIIAYGIAAEYCIINGLSEAEVFDEKYKKALKNALTPTNEKRIKERAFL